MQTSLTTVWGSFVASVVLSLFFLSLFGYVPPGVAVAVLGGLAVWLTLVPPKEPSKREKAFWVGCAFLLMVIEITAITYDRHQQNLQFNQSAQALTAAVKEGQTVMQQEQDALSRLERIQNSQNIQQEAQTELLRETEHAEYASQQTAKAAEQRELKITALSLARDISALTENALMDQAKLPIPPHLPFNSPEDAQTWMNSPAHKALEAKQWEITHNSNADFNNKFRTSVRDVLTQFKKQTNWESKECDVALADYRLTAREDSQTMVEEIQFAYIEGCAGDLEREASTLP